MRLCKCGCGNGVKDMNVFVHGHNRRGYTHSDDTKRRIRETNLKTYSNPELIDKFRGENNPYFGMKHSDKIKAVMQHKAQERCNSPKFIQKISSATRAALKDPKRREKISNNSTAMWKNEVIREMLSAMSKERWADPELRKKKSEEEINRWKTDKQFADRMRKSRNARPNKSETFLCNLLNEMYPGEWKFTGDFSFILNGKNPDFVNCNGQKKIIELFGEIWHKGETQEDRAKFFAPFGYKTLVVWWKELKKVDELKLKIERFCNHENI